MRLLGLNRDTLRRLEKTLGYRFRNRALLKMALTHRSQRFESAGVDVDNQRLEFLGDAVLGFVTAAYLYETRQDKDEGVLTALRSRVTSGKALATLARTIDLGTYLLVGKGEERSGGRERESNLTDALEAILGAVYLDGGTRGFDKVFARLFRPLIEGLGDDVWHGNPKGRLQEYAQAEWRSSPSYHLVSSQGPAHAATFTVEVEVNGRRCGRGEGRSKQDAERLAATVALEGIQD
jgi:ribonuclease-3